jgi:hypothetical protein
MVFCPISFRRRSKQAPMLLCAQVCNTLGATEALLIVICGIHVGLKLRVWSSKRDLKLPFLAENSFNTFYMQHYLLLEGLKSMQGQDPS